MRRVLIWKGDPATECELEGTITGKMTVIAQNAEEMIVVTKTAGHMVRTSRMTQPRYVAVKHTVWKIHQSIKKSHWIAESICSW